MLKIGFYINFWSYKNFFYIWNVKEILQQCLVVIYHDSNLPSFKFFVIFQYDCFTQVFSRLQVDKCILMRISELYWMRKTRKKSCRISAHSVNSPSRSLEINIQINTVLNYEPRGKFVKSSWKLPKYVKIYCFFVGRGKNKQNMEQNGINIPI